MAQCEARIKIGVMMDENKVRKVRHETNLAEQKQVCDADHMIKKNGKEARLAEKMRENLRRRKLKQRSRDN